MRRVSISERTARALLSAVTLHRVGGLLGRELAELESALSRIKSPKRVAAKKATRARKQEKAKTKRDARAEVREHVMMRALGFCECGCGSRVGETELELDHFWGKARAESVETCWALSWAHHRFKTRNEPDAAYWLKKFAAHCRRFGYATEAAKATSRLSFVEARKAVAS